MKLNPDFVIYHSKGVSMLVPDGDAAFSGMVRGNKTFGAVLELLRRDTDEASVVAALCARFDAPESVIAADVKKALAELRRIGAIDE